MLHCCWKTTIWTIAFFFLHILLTVWCFWQHLEIFIFRYFVFCHLFQQSLKVDSSLCLLEWPLFKVFGYLVQLLTFLPFNLLFQYFRHLWVALVFMHCCSFLEFLPLLYLFILPLFVINVLMFFFAPSWDDKDVSASYNFLYIINHLK